MAVVVEGKRWETVRLGEIAEIFSGFAFKSDDLGKEGLPVIKIANIQNKKVLKDCEDHLPENLISPKLEKYWLQEDDFLIAMTGAGSLGKVGKMRKMERRYLVNQRVAIVRTNSEIADPEFVYQVGSQETYERLLYGWGLGAGQPNVSSGQIASLIIPFPQIEIQKRIASILSAYDDLIENNLRRIKIVEEMAQSFYWEWFVKFRFPGHQRVKMVDSPLGKIPEGWEIRQVDEVIETLGGGTPSTKELSYWEGGNIDWYSPSDLTASGSMFITGSSKKITQLGLEKSSAKLFPAYSLMMTSRATIGVISINTEEACTNQGFITCIPNDRFSVFHLYFWTKESREKIISVASGATFKEISRGEFREFLIAVPPPPIENTFTETVEPMCRLIENLIKKNHNLVVTRDLLLPKLISGELDVSELDIKTGRNDPSPLAGEGWDGGNG